MTVLPSSVDLLVPEEQLLSHPQHYRMLTGDRPTGQLHLGHYFGSLRNRVRLQESGVETFIVIADYQVLTDRRTPGDVRGNVRELVLDYLAVGVDPRITTVFTHSAVSALNQLMMPFLSLVSVSELQRNPTVKAEARDAGLQAITGLMLTYPVHQAADILFCRGNVVPVGRDQLPHIEQTRVVARRFNERYGAGMFPEPQALLSPAPALLGVDGRKMSKSRGNGIAIAASEDETAALIRQAVTDAERTITFDPERRPEVASLLLTAALCTGESPERIADQIGSGGAAGLKRVVTEAVNDHLRGVRQRRRDLANEPAFLAEVLRDGNDRANAIAEATLRGVTSAMGMSY